ncbi:hypothetical protein [Kurthia massiliensis]|uniref:hypothetical protein n=1 Tax=Kurthia massiliensis TaxID=1033739 RepID=UPI000289ED42|nr:hypothetical protein [Kurthia massiliensis]
MIIMVMVFGIVILTTFPILFIWLYQRQRVKDLERAMYYLSHTGIQYHKDIPTIVSSQPSIQQGFQRLSLKKATD